MRRIMLGIIVVSTLLLGAMIVGIVSYFNQPDQEQQKEKAVKRVESKPAVKEDPSHPISLLFGGDAMMDWSVKNAVTANGASYPWQNIAPFVAKADMALLNLETAVTTQKGAQNKQFTFKSDPNSLKGIKEAGFDGVSLANNHSMDFGKEGLLDTFENLKQHQIPYIGAGKDANEAYASLKKTINGKTISILAFSKVLPDISWYAGDSSPGVASGYQLEAMYQKVKEEKVNADFVFVFIHWGIEKQLQFNGEQQTIAHTLIDSGADGVIGSHPHVLQGFEFYKAKPIAYSLGNFLFPDYVSGESAETGMVELTIADEQIQMRFHPMYIANNQIHHTSAQHKEERFKKLHQRSHQVDFVDNQIIGTKKAH